MTTTSSLLRKSIFQITPRRGGQINIDLLLRAVRPGMAIRESCLGDILLDVGRSRVPRNPRWAAMLHGRRCGEVAAPEDRRSISATANPVHSLLEQTHNPGHPPPLPPLVLSGEEDCQCPTAGGGSGGRKDKKRRPGHGQRLAPLV